MRKYLSAWLMMLVVSVANGAVRDLTYGKYLEELRAHQLSTLSGMVLLGLVMGAFLRAHRPASATHAIGIGLTWLALTLAFEFLFFHYVGGHSWRQLLRNYDLSQGRIWILIPAWITVAPWLFFHIQSKS